MGTCCWLTHKGFDGKQTIVFYLIASRPDGILSWGGGSTVRTVKVWGPTLRGGEALGKLWEAPWKAFKSYFKCTSGVLGGDGRILCMLLEPGKV